VVCNELGSGVDFEQVGGGMFVCMHRFFAHQAFQSFAGFILLVLGLLGTLTNQGPILWWSSKHNRHPKFCDQPNDPHSWLQTIYMYSWIWWTYYEFHTDWQFVPRAYRKNQALVILNAIQQPIIVYSFIALLIHTIGVPWTIYGYWIPSIVSTLGSLDFNLQFHPKDHASSDHRYDEGDGTMIASKGKNCRATDDPTRGEDEPWIPILIGETLHLDHHLHPRKAFRPGVDIAYKGIVSYLCLSGSHLGRRVYQYRQEKSDQ
jgi:hypothetical protein